MNIFYVDSNYDMISRYLCDKHIVKMVLETAQILSTAHHFHDSPHKDYVYKKTHEKHPSVKWVYSGYVNYEWTFNLLISLFNEYYSRYNKIHKSTRLLSYLSYNPVKNQLPFWQPPQAMPEQYKSGDAIFSYRKYYIYEKSYFASWNRSIYGKPYWFMYALET